MAHDRDHQGATEDTVIVPIRPGMDMQINASDLRLLDGWKLLPLKAKNNRTYIRLRRYEGGRDRQLYLHRVITDPPKGMVVDHINGDGLDNRRCNLRVCTVTENNRNHLSKRRNNTSGFIGVSYVKSRDRWMAHITSDRFINLGHYSTPEEAARVRDQAARELHGEFATLNFPKESS